MDSPNKIGIKYYSMDVNHNRDTAVKLLFNEFGSDGYWVWQCLISFAYEEYGYYIPLNDKDWLILFATDVCKLRVALVDEIIKGCVRRGLFDQSVFNAFNVLTSKRIQENFLDATDRRKEDRIIIKDYALINEENYKKIQIVDISKKNVNISIKNGDISKQIKGKEIKVNEIKITYAYVSDHFKKIFDEWIIYRKQKKQPLTESTMIKQCELLQKFDEKTAIEMIETSIINGWTGIFPIKKHENYETNKSNSKKISSNIDYSEPI